LENSENKFCEDHPAPLNKANKIEIGLEMAEKKRFKHRDDDGDDDDIRTPRNGMA